MLYKAVFLPQTGSLYLLINTFIIDYILYNGTKYQYLLECLHKTITSWTDIFKTLYELNPHIISINLPLVCPGAPAANVQ